MFPPIFQLAVQDAAVRAVLGESPTRLFLFGHAPEGTEYPYAAWQIVSGSPENYLTNRPTIDNYVVQVDVYAKNDVDAREGAQALRDALEDHAHIIAWRGESRDNETGSFRVSFDVEFWTNR